MCTQRGGRKPVRQGVFGVEILTRWSKSLGFLTPFFVISPALAADSLGSEVPVFSWSGYFHAIALLCLLLALLWIAVWAVRRSGKFNFLPNSDTFPKKALQLEVRLPLGPKKNLIVVRFLNKRLLLGVTDQRITLIQELELDDDSQPLDIIDRSNTTAKHFGSTRNAGGDKFSQLLSKSFSVENRHSSDAENDADTSTAFGDQSSSSSRSC